MGKQTSDTGIQSYAAGDLILEEFRTRILAAADDAITGYDPTGTQPIDAGVAAVKRFNQDASGRIAALISGLGTPAPPNWPDAFVRIEDEVIKQLQHGLAVKLHAYSEGLWAEIDRLQAQLISNQAQMESIQAEITRNMAIQKNMAIVLSLTDDFAACRRLADDSAACFRQAIDLLAKVDRLTP